MFTKDELLTLSQGIIFAIRNNNEAKTLVSSMEAYEALERLWRDPQAWGKKAIINTARSHYFSSDRSIKEYNETIWNLSQV